MLYFLFFLKDFLSWKSKTFIVLGKVVWLGTDEPDKWSCFDMSCAKFTIFMFFEVTDDATYSIVECFVSYCRMTKSDHILKNNFLLTSSSTKQGKNR